MRVDRFHGTENAAQNVQISAQEREPRFTIFLLCAGCDDDNVGLTGFRMRAGADLGTARRRVVEVSDLALKKGGLGVDEYDFGAYGLKNQGIGESGADVAAAEDCDCGLEPGLVHIDYHLGWWNSERK